MLPLRAARAWLALTHSHQGTQILNRLHLSLSDDTVVWPGMSYFDLRMAFVLQSVSSHLHVNDLSSGLVQDIKSLGEICPAAVQATDDAMHAWCPA